MKKSLPALVAVAVSFVAVVIAVALWGTSGVVDAADAFFDATRRGDIHAAHQQLASELRQRTSPQQLATFLADEALIGATATRWSTRRVSGRSGELGGTVTAADGQQIPLQIQLLKEADGWRILALQRTPAAPATRPEPPSEAERVALVRRSMRDFAAAVAAQSMAGFHATLSAPWRDQASIADLDAAYGGLYGRGANLGVFDTLLPHIDRIEGPDDRGVLSLSGWYLLAADLRFEFAHEYVLDDGQWRLLRFGYEVK